MRFKIKSRRDGRFVCRTATGREIDGRYGRDPLTRVPRVLSLSIVIEDRSGNPRGLVTEYDVTGYLDKARLRELAEALECRAEAVERGEPEAADVIKIDLTSATANSR